MLPIPHHPLHARSGRRLLCAALAITCLDVASGANANPRSITTSPDGTVHADGLDVPVSEFLSPEARAAMIARLAVPGAQPTPKIDVPAARAISAKLSQTVIDKWQKVYPARIRSVTMGGVRTDVVVPAAGVAPVNRTRVLINLHGGGFFTGAGNGGLAEAIPLAGRGRITVVTVDYRLAPEHHFPAASEDVANVYRTLLRHYKPSHIGIYGCSAGGALVAQALAWFQKEKLPRPGAAGIFCSGAMPSFWYGGDSYATAPMMNGQYAMARDIAADQINDMYLAQTDSSNPQATPGIFPKVLAQFPPTLLVTGTRDTAMSNALATNAALLNAGVETQLLVQEGIGHGDFTLMVGTPEARLAYDVIWRFFDRHLAH